MKPDEAHDLLFDYLTGDLSAEDAAKIREHLGSGDPEWAGALAEVEAVAAQMLEEVDQVDPPAVIEERLAARLDAVQPVAGQGVGYRTTLLAIAATALVAICGTWAVRSALDSGRSEEIARMQAEIGRRKDELGALQRSFEANEDFAIALRSPNARLVSFEAADANLDAAVGRAIWDVETGRLCLSVSGLPEARAGLRHSVWFDDGRKPRRLTEFRVTPAGEAAMVVELGEDEMARAQTASILVSLDSKEATDAGDRRVLLVGKLGSTVQIAFSWPNRHAVGENAAG